MKSEILLELKRVKYKDLEDMVYRLQLTNEEIVEILDVKYLAGSTKGYTLPTGIYETSDNNLLLKSLLPKEVKVTHTIDDIRLNSNLTTNRTLKPTKKSFFFKIVGSTQLHSGELRNVPGFIQLTHGTYKSDKPIKFTSIDKTHLNADCIEGSIVNGIRESILHFFALDQVAGHEIHNQPRSKLF